MATQHRSGYQNDALLNARPHAPASVHPFKLTSGLVKVAATGHLFAFQTRKQSGACPDLLLQNQAHACLIVGWPAMARIASELARRPHKSAAVSSARQVLARSVRGRFVERHCNQALYSSTRKEKTHDPTSVRFLHE